MVSPRAISTSQGAATPHHRIKKFEDARNQKKKENQCLQEGADIFKKFEKTAKDVKKSLNNSPIAFPAKRYSIPVDKYYGSSSQFDSSARKAKKVRVTRDMGVGQEGSGSN